MTALVERIKMSMCRVLIRLCVSTQLHTHYRIISVTHTHTHTAHLSDTHTDILFYTIYTRTYTHMDAHTHSATRSCSQMIRQPHCRINSPGRRDAAARIDSRTGDPVPCADNGNTDRRGRRIGADTVVEVEVEVGRGGHRCARHSWAKKWNIQ